LLLETTFEFVEHDSVRGSKCCGVAPYPYSPEKKNPFVANRCVRLFKYWNVEIIALRFGFLKPATIHKALGNSKISQREQAFAMDG